MVSTNQFIDRRTYLLFLFFTLLIGSSLYLKSFHYDFTNFDDSIYVEKNGDIRRINAESIQHWFTRNYGLIYLPVTIASYAVDYQVWLLSPFGYRLTNFILHWLNCFLVFLITIRFSKSRWLALATSLVFLIHPVQIESVVWISERKNVLSAFFCLFSIHQFVNSRQKSAALLYILAVLSKPTSFVLPIIFMLYEIFSKKKNKAWKFSACLLALGLSISFLTVRMHVEEVHYRGGTFLTNLYVMITVFMRYIQLLIHPYHQQILYLTKVYRSIFEWPVWASALVFLLLLISIIRLWKSRYYFCFWACWYLVFIAPPLNVVAPLGMLMNDRYLYLPLIGFFNASLGYAENKMGEVFGQKFATSVLIAFIVIVLPFFYVLSTQRVHDWRNQTALWEAELTKNHFTDPRVYVGLASSLHRMGKTEQSVKVLKEAIKYHKDEGIFCWQAQNYLELGDLSEVKRHLDLAAKYSGDIHRAEFYSLYGQYYERLNQFDEAEKAYQKSLEIDLQVSAMIYLYDLYRKMGKYDEAFAMLERAEREDRDSIYVLMGRCRFYLGRKEYEKADEYFKRILRIYPRHPITVEILDQVNKAVKNA